MRERKNFQSLSHFKCGFLGHSINISMLFHVLAELRFVLKQLLCFFVFSFSDDKQLLFEFSCIE